MLAIGILSTSRALAREQVSSPVVVFAPSRGRAGVTAQLLSESRATPGARERGWSE
ncbi:hypothetical protein GCM10027064_07260 [Microbacterium petrolearium]